MPTIKQYRPGFFTGFENEVKEFNSLEELLNLDFVKNFKNTLDDKPNPHFHQFSISNHAGKRGYEDEYTNILMAEFKDGSEWWVVGYISETEIVNQLPVWEPKEKK
jgi:hypothetical protein